MKQRSSYSGPDHNCRSNTHRTRSCRVRLFFIPAELDREIAAEAPEGAFRLMEQEGFRRIRNRVQAGFSEDGARKVRTVDVEEGADLPGIAQGVRAVTDDLQAVGREGGNGGIMGGLL